MSKITYSAKAARSNGKPQTTYCKRHGHIWANLVWRNGQRIMVCPVCR